MISEPTLDSVVALFFATRIFGPERAELLAAQMPATAADAAAQRDAETAALRARLKKIDNAQNSKILELEELPADPADTAAAAMRARIRARFAELHHERQQVETQLKALDATTPAAADLALLDRLPFAGDILPGLSPALKARLFQVFDLGVLWHKPDRQATVYIEISENTLQAVLGILDPSQDGYDDTNPDAGPSQVGDLVNTSIRGFSSHDVVGAARVSSAGAGRRRGQAHAAWCRR